MTNIFSIINSFTSPNMGRSRDSRGNQSRYHFKPVIREFSPGCFKATITTNAFTVYKEIVVDRSVQGISISEEEKELACIHLLQAFVKICLNGVRGTAPVNGNGFHCYACDDVLNNNYVEKGVIKEGQYVDKEFGDSFVTVTKVGKTMVRFEHKGSSRFKGIEIGPGIYANSSETLSKKDFELIYERIELPSPNKMLEQS